MERRVWTWPQQHSDDARSRCSVLTGGSSCLWVSCDFNSHCIRQKKLDLWWWETFYYNLFKKTFYFQLLGAALIICLLKCFLLISSRQNAVKSEWQKIIQTLFFLLVNCFTLPKWSLYSLIFLCKKRLFNSWSLISSWHDNLDFFLRWTDWVARIRERVSELRQNEMDNTEHCIPCVHCVLTAVYLYLWNCCLSMEVGSTQGYSGKGINTVCGVSNGCIVQLAVICWKHLL